MFQAKEKCPNCRGTNLIRVGPSSEYMPGECANCRFDRRAELPEKPKELVKKQKSAE